MQFRRVRRLRHITKGKTVTDKDEYLTIEEVIAHLINQSFIPGDAPLVEILKAQCAQFDDELFNAQCTKIDGDTEKNIINKTSTEEIQRLKNLLEILELKIKLASAYQNAIEDEMKREDSSLLLNPNGLRTEISKNSVKQWLKDSLISGLEGPLSQQLNIKRYKYHTKGLAIIDDVIIEFYEGEGKEPPKQSYVSEWIVEKYQYSKKTAQQICRILSPDT
tara:strand:+ start:1961 stop:2620 length:660 start_codon:yes stop_codon:yes gene_type:complete